MNIFYKAYARTFQTIIKIALPFAPWSTPKPIIGAGVIGQLPQKIKNDGISSVLLVVSGTVTRLGFTKKIIDGLDALNIKYAIYDKVTPNPTIGNVEEGLKLFHDIQAEAIIAFGGGSPIDCGKAIAAKVARPKKDISKMKGLLKILKKTPPVYAIPTTAGTGSEATIVTVISNPSTHEKYPITDPKLIPAYAILDPEPTVGLPPHVTAATGIDALTHAIEAYIGNCNTKKTIKDAEDAVKLIFDNIKIAYDDGTNLVAREAMLIGSFKAGIAFSRAFVGYVHAIAHTIGGFYNLSHGLSNAVLLPYVLEFYGKSIYKKLSKLADIVGISGNSDEEKAKAFIQAIKDMNASMKIPEKFDGIGTENLDIMVDRAYKEANPLYPVPKMMSKADIKDVLLRVIS